MGNFAQPDSVNSSMTDGTHVSLQPQLDATFTSQTTKTARKINTSEYQVRYRYLKSVKPFSSLIRIGRAIFYSKFMIDRAEPI